MSFDIFIQGFREGDASDASADALSVALAPYIDDREGFPVLRVADAEAEIYGPDGSASFMVNHVCGAAIYDVLVEVATACDLVIMPVGCPTAITREDQRGHLPDVLREAVVLVTSGQELDALIRSA